MHGLTEGSSDLVEGTVAQVEELDGLLLGRLQALQSDLKVGPEGVKLHDVGTPQGLEPGARVVASCSLWHLLAAPETGMVRVQERRWAANQPRVEETPAKRPRH